MTAEGIFPKQNRKDENNKNASGWQLFHKTKLRGWRLKNYRRWNFSKEKK